MKSMAENRTRAYALSTVAVAFLIVGVGIFARTNDDAIVMAIAVASLVAVLAPAVLRSDYRVVEPLTFVIASVVLGFTLKAFYLVAFVGDNDTVDEKLLLGLSIGSLEFGGAVILIGLVAFVCGYLVIKNARRKNRNQTNWSISRLVIVSAVLTFISLVGFIVFVLKIGASFDGLDSLSAKRFRDDDGAVTASRTGTLDYLLYRIALLAKFPLYLMYIYWIKTRYKMFSFNGAVLISSGMLALFVPFFVNNRAGILLPIVDLIMLGALMTGKFNLKFVISVGSAAVLLVLAGGYLRSGGDFSGIYDSVFGGRYLVDITKTAHIVNYFNDTNDYFFGVTLISWIFKLIPFLSPPSLEFENLGFYLGEVVFGYLSSGVPPGVIAELFMNFGWTGVVLGMFAVGAGLRKFYEAYGQSVTDIESLLIYTLVCTRFTIFLFNNGFSIAILKTILDVVVVYGIFHVVRRKRKRKA